MKYKVGDIIAMDDREYKVTEILEQNMGEIIYLTLREENDEEDKKSDEYDWEYELVRLTKYLVRHNLAVNMGGGLGGEYGYGCEYENDTFMIHEFCWCWEKTCKWCNGYEPNFVYKPEKVEIHWYKWIGRGMKINKENVDAHEVINICIRSTKEDEKDN